MSRGLTLLLLLLLVTLPALPQAMVEYSLGAARAASSVAPIGKNIGAVFGKLQGAVPSAPAGAKPGSPTARTVSSATAVPLPPPKEPSAACAEDPTKVTAGLEYQELMERCGTPALTTTSGETQTIRYAAKGKSVVITVTAGKVSAVETEQKQQTAGVIILQ